MTDQILQTLTAVVVSIAFCLLYFVYYPQPFGFQAEWNIGRGPALNDQQTAVVVRRLDGFTALFE